MNAAPKGSSVLRTGTVRQARPAVLSQEQGMRYWRGLPGKGIVQCRVASGDDHASVAVGIDREVVTQPAVLAGDRVGRRARGSAGADRIAMDRTPCGVNYRLAWV